MTFDRAGTYPYYCANHTSGSIGSQRGTILVEPVAAPFISLTEPTNGATFTTSDPLTLIASATDPNGVVMQVEFFADGAWLGAVTAEPFSLAVQLLPGTHELTAVAIDNENGRTTSDPVTITVNSVPLTDPIPARNAKGDLTVELQTVANNLSSPLGMAVPDDGSGRMFVYDQAGVIWLLTAAGMSATPVLDVRASLVTLGSYDERGLLGAAAHPDFANHPFLYTYTSEPAAGLADFTSSATNHDHQSVIAEWQMDPANPDQVDPASRRELLRIDQPQANHNGGTLRFGPDGLLYVSLGDGGAADDQGPGHDPGGNGQAIWNVYGKLLRIDVDGLDSLNGQYGIPGDNPFYSWGFVDEIFAYGLRNPFSYSFDRETGELYLADVGQNKVEEVNLIVNGGNYGWPIQEGTFYFDPNGAGPGFVTATPVVPVPADLVDPIAQYDHDDGSAVVGGYVYRGAQLPDLVGRYVFGDWGTFGVPSGRLFCLNAMNGIEELRIGLDDRPLGYWLKGFGEDASGELYVMVSSSLGPAGNTGRILKIVAAPTNAPPVASADTIQRSPGSAAKAPLSTLLSNDQDPDGDPIHLVLISPTSAQGGAVTQSEGWVIYTPPPGFTNEDSFTYTIADPHGAEATGTVRVTLGVATEPARNLRIADLGNGSYLLSFDGIPGRSYRIEYTEDANLQNWQPLGGGTADPSGAFVLVDTPAGGSLRRFYRSLYP